MPGKSLVTADRKKARLTLFGAAALVIMSCTVQTTTPTPIPLPSLPVMPRPVQGEGIKPHTPRPTGTPAPPTPTNTRVVKDTPTPMPPTDTPIPPSATPTSPPTPTNTPHPTPTQPRPATILVAPVAGREFIGPDEKIILQWMEIPGLAADEYYVLDLSFQREGKLSHDLHWLKETSMQAPRYLYDRLEGERMCTWTVTIYRRTGTLPDGNPDGVPVGLTSDDRWFYWLTPEAPTPTPE